MGSFQLLTHQYDVSCRLTYVSSLPTCWEAFCFFFNHEWMFNFVKCFFDLCWDDHMLFLVFVCVLAASSLSWGTWDLSVRPMGSAAAAHGLSHWGPWTLQSQCTGCCPMACGILGFPGGSDSKESACQCRRPRFDPWIGKIPWRKEWILTPVFLPGGVHGQRSLTGYTQWGHKELDMTEWLRFHMWDLSSPTKDWTHIPSIERWIFNH